MKRNKLFLFTVLIAALALVIPACGGGGGGGGGGGLSDGTFIKTLQLASNNQWTGPIYSSTWTDWRVQTLALADAIDGSGYITSIAFKAYNTTSTAITCPDITIRMGHTSLSALTNTFSNNVEEGKGSVETVLTNAQVVIPVVSAGDYFEIQLDTPFYYNGVDNLVVDFIRTGFCDGDLLLYSDNTFSNGSLWTDTLANLTGNLDIPLNMEFQFEGGVDTLEDAASPGVGNGYPFNNPLKVQLLYDAAFINGSGPITGIAMRTGTTAVTTEESYTYTMRVGHTTLTDLTTDWDGNFSGTPVTVANNAVFNVPAGVPVADYIWIPMPDESFNYNGTDNLIVEIDVSNASGVTWWSSISTPNNTRAYGASGSSTATLVDTSQYDISFRFYGGTMDNIIGTGGSDASRWFTTSGTGATDQYLYMASELGTSGSITKIAGRLELPTTSLAVDYPNFDVVMSHTSATTLGTDVATNVPNPVTVHSGTFSLPAGLIEGDWIEIPLTTSFSYDSTQNLVVQVKSDAGTSSTSCAVLSDAARFPDRRLSNIDRSSSTGTNYNHLKDLRVWISK